MNIYEKMSAITSDLGSVAKNLNVGVGKSSYKAVGEADILAAVKPLEARYGIYSYPANRQIVDREFLTSENNYNGNVVKKTNLFMRVETTYRFVNTENPDEYIDIVSYGDGLDTNDKSPGKAMTYSDKYALMKAYKITTGDDPDQTASSDEPFEKHTTGPVCENCGNAILACRRKDGTLMSAEQMAEETRRRTGRALCKKCMIAEGNK